MVKLYDTMMSPEVEILMSKVGSKFGLCTLAATRAREINAYFGQLGEGLGAKVPPQVASVARKPLSISFEEIAADKIVPIRVEDLPSSEAAEDEAADPGDIA
jgi:DNA-directed RNA polymerase subunit omega